MKYFFCKSQFFIGLFSIGLVFLHGETKIEEYFPELSKILSDLEDNSPILLENNQLVQEQIGNEIVADSVKGLKLSINLSAQSIHEDRPDQSFLPQIQKLRFNLCTKTIISLGCPPSRK